MAAFIPMQPHFRCPVLGCDGVDGAGYGGPCQRHACKRASCPLPKAEGSGYCSHHACDLLVCSKSRLDTSVFCNLHACQYSGCARCKTGVGTPEGATADACEEHTCQAEGCHDPRRFQRPYCREHSCRWSGRVPCNQAVEAGSMACRDHVCQYEEGCTSVRKVKSNSQACDNHTCATPRCYQAAGLRGKHCAEHTCIWDPCSKKGGVSGSPFCDTHKCEAPVCLAPVASKLDWFCEHHKCRYSGSDCQGGWLVQGPFCKEHTCGTEGCGAPVRRGGPYCISHTCILRPNGLPCFRGRKSVGSQLCDEHSCTKCTQPRESIHTTRCRKHRKDDMSYMYIPRAGEKSPRHGRKKKSSPRGSSSSLEEKNSEDSATYGDASRRLRGIDRVRTPPPVPPPPRSMSPQAHTTELLDAATQSGKLISASTNVGVTPVAFRSDPRQRTAYGHGFRDACLHMAWAMTDQMEMEMARPMSPSRNMAEIVGPRFTALGEEESR